MGVILAFLAGFLLLTVLGMLSVVVAVRVRRAEPRVPDGQVDLITRALRLDHRVLARLREVYAGRRDVDRSVFRMISGDDGCYA